MGRARISRLAAWICAGGTLLSGCSTSQESQTPPEERTVDEGPGGGDVSVSELDSLVRAFSKRYVSRLYSAVDGIRRDNPDADERRRAQTLLTDLSTNIYDIASAPDSFTGVLDLLVVTTLAERVWIDHGRANEIFGEHGEPLERALREGAAQARDLGEHVLDQEQFETVLRLIDEWYADNPEVDRVSFIRFADFAMGRGGAEAEELLGSGGLFPGISETGDAVDDAREVAERVFFRAKQEGTLLRWQAIAVKEDLFATPEYAQTLGDIGDLTDQIKGLPDLITEQREALLGDLDERFEQADQTIDNARAALEQANAFTDSLVPVSESIDEMLHTGADLMTKIEQMNAGSFDLERFEQAARQTGEAAERVEAALASAEGLLESEEAQSGASEIGSQLGSEFGDTLDSGVETAAEEGEDLVDALFWRGVILLGLLLIVLVLYRLIAILMTNRLDRSRRERRPHTNDGVHAR